jgi:hypothetical protein
MFEHRFTFATSLMTGLVLLVGVSQGQRPPLSPRLQRRHEPLDGDIYFDNQLRGDISNGDYWFDKDAPPGADSRVCYVSIHGDAPRFFFHDTRQSIRAVRFGPTLMRHTYLPSPLPGLLRSFHPASHG